MQPHNELLDMPNVAVTPHIGTAVDTARDNMARVVAENVIAKGEGQPLPTPVM